MTARRIAPALAAAAVFTTRAALAQGALDPGCPSAPAPLPAVPTLAQAQAYYQTQLVRDACQKATDVFQLLAPQLGTSVAGGNVVLGSGGALGGLGRFSLGLRANLVSGGLPQLQDVTLSPDGPQRTAIPTKHQVLGLPTADLAVGLIGGYPIGLTRFGGIDAIVSAAYVPNITSGDVAVRTAGSSLQLGLGARLGLLEEGRFVPGVSLSYLHRSLPTVGVTARSGQDTVRVRALDAGTGAWRLVASKRVSLVGLAVGVGRDRYSSQATLDAYVAPRAGVAPGGYAYTTPAYSGRVAGAAQTLTRTNYFADASLGGRRAALVAEVGRASGGSARATYNTFGSHTAGEGYTYFSLGVRAGR